MTEFAFEGGHREGPDFLQHYEDRRKGMPRQNASLQSNMGPWGDPHSVLPLPRADSHVPAKVYRMDSHGLGNRGEGLIGEVPHDMVAVLVCEGIIPPLERMLAEQELKKHLNERWGGGRYRVTSAEHGDYEVVVAGPSLDAPAPEHCPLAPAEPEAGEEEEIEIDVGVTVWLDLSRDGPYKVVGRYEHPLGASVPAHHPHDAPNTFETVRVVEGLWLCQDVKGVVHILAEGSLTTKAPASRFSLISQAASWCWGHREVVLWVRLIEAEWDAAFGFMIGRLLAHGYTPAQIQAKLARIVRVAARTVEVQAAGDGDA